MKYASTADAPVLGGIAAILALAATAIALRRRAPEVTFWIGWFFLFVLPVSHLLGPIGAVAAERFIYIASLSACALAAIGGSTIVEPHRPAPLRVATVAAVALIVVGLSAATIARNAAFR